MPKDILCTSLHFIASFVLSFSKQIGFRKFSQGMRPSIWPKNSHKAFRCAKIFIGVLNCYMVKNEVTSVCQKIF